MPTEMEEDLWGLCGCLVIKNTLGANESDELNAMVEISVRRQSKKGSVPPASARWPSPRAQTSPPSATASAPP